MSENEIDVNHEEKLENILQSNHYIRHRVQRSVNEFLHVREDLLHQLENKNLNNISKEFAPLINAMGIEALNQQVTSNKVQLALCGENSSGKTSFIHLLLGIEDILPSDVGPITARIVKMTYAKAEEACAIIYSSLEASFQNEIDDRVNLVPFFILDEEQDEPDWEGISDALAIHVKRPKDIDVKSDEFAIWARHFIEIRLPSPTLKLGIDVYDTAGFRIADAQILKDCLYDLVRLVHPTLVFLYDNPSGTDETNDCFLALKKSLRHLDSSNIFFLNTKADINYMVGINKMKTEKQFIDFLNNERIKRYELLLKTPGMVNSMPGGLPKSFDKCNCFDICSVNSQTIVPWGPILNESAIHRLIQFVANSDLIMAQRVSNLVLPAIEVFFDLALITSHRTEDQLQQLRTNALQWIENYFQEHREAFNTFLAEIFDKIINRFVLIKDDLARRAAQQKDVENIKTFIKLAFKQEIMKSVVYGALRSLSTSVLEKILSNQNLMINATSNEILITSLRTDLSDRWDTINEESINTGIVRYFMNQTITAPALMVTDILFSEEKDENIDETRNHLLSYVKHHQSGSDRVHETQFNPLHQAHQYLDEMRHQLMTTETMFATAISTWCRRQKLKLQQQINQQYEAAIVILPVRHQVHDILQPYAHHFVRIECQLQAAQDLAKFNGEKPSIRFDKESISQSSTTVYTINEVEWGSIKKNLFVKRLTRPIPNRPNTSYLEAHYHRKIINLNIPHVIKLTYLYENQLPDGLYELWMIFETPPPGIKRNLNHFLEEYKKQQKFISLKKLLEIILPIINALAGLHENELIHRNIIPSNILLDEEDQSFLADLGDWHLTTSDQSINTELHHHISVTPNDINDDLKAFGQLSLKLCAIVYAKEVSSTVFQELNKVIEICFKATLKTVEVRDTLKYLYNKLKPSLE